MAGPRCRGAGKSLARTQQKPGAMRGQGWLTKMVSNLYCKAAIWTCEDRIYVTVAAWLQPFRVVLGTFAAELGFCHCGKIL